MKLLITKWFFKRKRQNKPPLRPEADHTTSKMQHPTQGFCRCLYIIFLNKSCDVEIYYIPLSLPT